MCMNIKLPNSTFDKTVTIETEQIAWISPKFSTIEISATIFCPPPPCKIGLNCLRLWAIQSWRGHQKPPPGRIGLKCHIIIMPENNCSLSTIWNELGLIELSLIELSLEIRRRHLQWMGHVTSSMWKLDQWHHVPQCGWMCEERETEKKLVWTSRWI